ncbi:VOC family protein [Falsiroseomonas selenitidurans]|uniref:VOC family protein n=1 Tax=Falsiroseomonas selenitidurans TaxID=2716335 RepID=A0ABX1DWU9_9PROT|nr:VOC family protein [Falsiroseomonas selenitidurans]NKC29387.1 VOC family protein [Falsiroseomonas selenitidurans]
MFSHATLGTNDLPRAIAFYDALLAPLGLARFHTAEGEAGYARRPDASPQFWLMRPIDGRPASPGNGATLGFEAPDRATVRAVHAAGLQHGGAEEGGPGLRPHYHADFYGAYLRDPDGNKLCCVCHRPE